MTSDTVTIEGKKFRVLLNQYDQHSILIEWYDDAREEWFPVFVLKSSANHANSICLSGFPATHNSDVVNYVWAFGKEYDEKGPTGHTRV